MAPSNHLESGLNTDGGQQDNSLNDKWSFRIKNNFLAEYPFESPKITFKTKIHHPSIDEKGRVSLPGISAENWKPETKTNRVIQSLTEVGNGTQPEHLLWADLAEEYAKDHKKFCKNAEEFTKKYGKKRPVDSNPPLLIAARVSRASEQHIHTPAQQGSGELTHVTA